MTATPAGDDLAFAHTLADLADAVALAHYRAEDVRIHLKGDGTPVSWVDQAVEKAILRHVLGERPDDAVLGEEVGAIPGFSRDRWVIDGIDGTHNYAAGFPGWGTIIGLERDGTCEVGIVTSPALKRRWWAVRGGGAWCATAAPDGTYDLAGAERLRASAATDLATASVIVIPYIGTMAGWRDGVARRFVPPETPRSQCFALNAVFVAAGELDATVLTAGGPWDYVATHLLVEEAGGRYHDAWGGARHDTETGVFSAAGVTGALLAELAALRPAEPDPAVWAIKVKRDIAANEAATARATTDGGAPHWTTFGIRSMQSMSARRRVTHAAGLLLDIVDQRAEKLAEPFVGVTTDGRPVTGLRTRRTGPRVSTAAVTDAALAFLQALTPAQRAQVALPLDAPDWRTWINVHMNHFRHGVMLEDLAAPVRQLALAIVRATLSSRAYAQARDVLRVNGLVAELTGDHEAFGEWPYFVSIFGSPAAGGAEPWGWQLDGHHLCLNCVVFDDRIVLTPTFMGSEPRHVDHGPLAGLAMFDAEEAAGLALVRSLVAAQRERAIRYSSILIADIPPLLQNAFDGRMQAGAFHDNLVLPYQGIPGRDLTDAQRGLLTSLLGTYTGWLGDGHGDVRLAEVTSHLDDTWFSWYGGTDDVAPFYYRAHSPVVLVEFDHHPGVVFDNEEPTRHHVHTVVRTPNGGDYGRDLLAEHHERFDHARGEHRARP